MDACAPRADHGCAVVLPYAMAMVGGYRLRPSGVHRGPPPGLAGPRGMALGMVAFFGYFIGQIVRPPMPQMPLVVAGGRDQPDQRVHRSLPDPARPATFCPAPAGAPDQRPERDDPRRDRGGLVPDSTQAGLGSRKRTLHRQLARLNDATLTTEVGSNAARAIDTRPSPSASRRLYHRLDADTRPFPRSNRSDAVRIVNRELPCFAHAWTMASYSPEQCG